MRSHLPRLIHFSCEHIFLWDLFRESEISPSRFSPPNRASAPSYEQPVDFVMISHRWDETQRWDRIFFNEHVYVLLWNSLQICFQHGYHKLPPWPQPKKITKDSPYKKIPEIFINFLYFYYAYLSTNHTRKSSTKLQNILLYTTKWNCYRSLFPLKNYVIKTIFFQQHQVR